MTGVITYATEKDVDEIRAVMEIGLAATENKDWYVTDDRAFIERHIAKEGYILKYSVDEKIAGFLIVRHPMLAEDNLGRYLDNCKEDLLLKVAHMESAAVLPEFRGQKIQKKLLMEAEETEHRSGMHYLMCTVHPDNCYSVDNLEQQGYKTILETEKYGGLRRRILCKTLV